jgi:hypothetical protein
MSILLSRKSTLSGAVMVLVCLPLALANDHPEGSAGKVAGPAVIGEVVSSSGAVLNGLTALADGILTSGSTLKTAERGTALVKFSADTQATLGERTSVSFQGKVGRVIAEVTSGTIAARAAGKDTLVLETPRYTIKPAGAGTAIYGVAMLPGKNTEVVARRGPVSITEKTSGARYVLKEGHYAEVAGAGVTPPAGEPQGQGQAPSPAPAAAAAGAPPGLLSSTPFVFVLSVGAGVGTGFALAEGPLAPSGPASPSSP